MPTFQGTRGTGFAGPQGASPLPPKATERGEAASAAQGGALYFLQKCPVNSTSTLSNSSRPSSMAKVSTQSWKSFNTP